MITQLKGGLNKKTVDKDANSGRNHVQTTFLLSLLCFPKLLILLNPDYQLP